jgi:hypothetical protein
MIIIARVAAAAAILGIACAAHAAGDYVSIVQETAINAPAETAWAKLKGHCDIGPLLKVTCDITHGRDGELGAVRMVNGHIEEVIVAQTPLSYTYAHVDTSMLVLGVLEVRPVSKTSSKVLYTAFYDQTSVPADEREAYKTRRVSRLRELLGLMKSRVEK